MLVLGKNLNEQQSLFISLQTIFGLNRSNALKICALVGISPKVKLKKLTVSQTDRLIRICREEVDSNLIRYPQNNISLLVQLKHYKGIRHMFGLPLRGQRTRTNAQTSKRLIGKPYKSGAKTKKSMPKK